MAYVGNTATIQLGQMGLMTDLPPGDVPPGALILANNVTFETGLLTKAPGSLRYNINQVLPAGIVALWDWWPNNYSQRLIAACSNGAIYRDTGDRLFGSASAINTGLLSLTPKSQFVEGGQETASRVKKLFLFTGTNQLKVLEGDGTSFANVDSPAADWTTPNFPTFGFTHRNRLWAFMGQRAYASTTGDHEDFTSGGILTQNIYPGEGGNLIGGWIFKGRPFVFKEGGFVYYLDDSDADSDNWNWKKLASNFGLASPHGIFEITNDLLALNESGALVSYTATDALGGIDSADVYKILKIAQHIRDKTSLSGVEYTHSIYYPDKKQAFLTSRTSYQTNNDQLIVLDFNGQQPRASLWDKDAPDCLALRKDIHKVPRPIYGAADGYVYLMDKEDRLVHTTAYTGEFKIGHTDFRWLDSNIASKNKIFDHLAVEFLPTGDWNLSIDVYIDGAFVETITFPMVVRDDGLGSFTLGSDDLGREETQTIQKPLHGSGRRISLHCKQSGSNQNFALASLTIGFRASAEQATRI